MNRRQAQNAPVFVSVTCAVCGIRRAGCAAMTEYAPTARDGCRRRWVHLCFRLLSVTPSVGVIFCRLRPYPRLLKLTGVELCRLSASFFGAFRPFCFDGHCALCIKEGQKPHKNCLMSDASSFDRDGFLLRQGKARRKYCRIYKGFNAAWVKSSDQNRQRFDSRQLKLSGKYIPSVNGASFP